MFQQFRFVVFGGDPAHRAHLRIRHVAAFEGGIDARERPQRLRNAHLLLRRHARDTALPVEPLGAVGVAVRSPSLAQVELAQQREESMRCLGYFAPTVEQGRFDFVDRAEGEDCGCDGCHGSLRHAVWAYSIAVGVTKTQ